jgi:hypothetical protein
MSLNIVLQCNSANEKVVCLEKTCCDMLEFSYINMGKDVGMRKEMAFKSLWINFNYKKLLFLQN